MSRNRQIEKIKNQPKHTHNIKYKSINNVTEILKLKETSITYTSSIKLPKPTFTVLASAFHLTNEENMFSPTQTQSSANIPRPHSMWVARMFLRGVLLFRMLRGSLWQALLILESEC